MFKESQSTLYDYLLQIMPDVNFRDIRRFLPNNTAAKKLFSLWKDEKNKADNKTLKRPFTVSRDDVELMQREGLIKSEGENIKITSKGAEVLKTMILGDDKSSFEDDGSVLDYHTASANTKPRRKVKTGSNRFASRGGNNWYKKINCLWE